MGSAIIRKPGSGRPKTIRMAENIEKVDEKICWQENQPKTSKSIRKISEELNVQQSSVQRIVKRDFHLSAFRHVPSSQKQLNKNVLSAARNLFDVCQWLCQRRFFH